MRCEYDNCSVSATRYLVIAHAGVDDGICQSEVIALCGPHHVLMEKRYRREMKHAFKTLASPHCAHCDSPIALEEMIHSTGVLSVK